MTKQQTKPDRRQFSVRLPPELLNELQDDADRNERTLNGTVTLAVRQYLEGQR